MQFLPGLRPDRRPLIPLQESPINSSSSEDSIETKDSAELFIVNPRKKHRSTGALFFGKIGLKIQRKPAVSRPIVASVFSAFWTNKNFNAYKAKLFHSQSSWGNLMAETKLQNKILSQSRKMVYRESLRKNPDFGTSTLAPNSAHAHAQAQDSASAQTRVSNWSRNLRQTIANYTYNVMAQPEPNNVHEWEWISGFGFDHYLAEIFRIKENQTRTPGGQDSHISELDTKAEKCPLAKDDLSANSKEFSGKIEEITETSVERSLNSTKDCFIQESPGPHVDVEALQINSAESAVRSFAAIGTEVWDSDEMGSIGSWELEEQDGGNISHVSSNEGDVVSEWRVQESQPTYFETVSLQPGTDIVDDNFSDFPAEPRDTFISNFQIYNQRAVDLEDWPMGDLSPLDSGTIPRSMIMPKIEVAYSEKEIPPSLWDMLSLSKIAQCVRFKKELSESDEFSLFSIAKKQLYTPFNFSVVVLLGRNTEIRQNPVRLKRNTCVIFDDTPAVAESPDTFEKISSNQCTVSPKSILKKSPFTCSSPKFQKSIQIESPISGETRKDLDQELYDRVAHCETLVKQLSKSPQDLEEVYEVSAYFSQSFRFMMENYIFVAEDQVFQCSFWMDEARRKILTVFESLSGLGQEYALFLEFLSKTKACNTNLVDVQCRLSFLGESITQNGEVLDEVNDSIFELDSKIGEIIGPLFQIAQMTITNTRKLAEAYKIYYVLTEDLDLPNDRSQVHFTTFMNESDFVVANTGLFETPKYKEVLSDLQNWHQIVTDVKIDLQLHIQKIFSRVADLERHESLGPEYIWTQYNFENTVVYHSSLHGSIVSGTTCDSLDDVLMTRESIANSLSGADSGLKPLLSSEA